MNKFKYGAGTAYEREETRFCTKCNMHVTANECGFLEPDPFGCELLSPDFMAPKIGQKAFILSSVWERLEAECLVSTKHSNGPWTITRIHPRADYVMLDFPFVWLKFSDIEIVNE